MWLIDVGKLTGCSLGELWMEHDWDIRYDGGKLSNEYWYMMDAIRGTPMMAGVTYFHLFLAWLDEDSWRQYCAYRRLVG
jgi:hypothetical protein